MKKETVFTIIQTWLKYFFWMFVSTQLLAFTIAGTFTIGLWDRSAMNTVYQNWMPIRIGFFLAFMAASVLTFLEGK